MTIHLFSDPCYIHAGLADDGYGNLVEIPMAAFTVNFYCYGWYTGRDICNAQLMIGE